MTEQISYFQRVYSTFWGDDIFQWWFYFAIIIILIYEKRKMERAVYGIYPLCFLIALITPVARLIMKRVAPAWQYFARLYSMLPIPYMLAISAVFLINRICLMGVTNRNIRIRENFADNIAEDQKPVLKLLMTVGVCALIIFGGTNVYATDWMQKAQNIAKVPNEAIWICQELHKDKEVTIAVPETLVVYIRQTDAGIYMPYGRKLNKLGEELSKEQPDPEYVMTEAGRQGCDYIIIANNQENIDHFAGYGWQPYSKIGKYLVYEVKGVSKNKREHDEKHRLIKLTTLDNEGNPIVGSDGYASICYAYDQENNRVLESYLDANGNPTVTAKGYAAIRRCYVRYTSKVTSMTYLDADGKPVKNNKGYAEIRREFNENKQISKEIYWDEQGNPAAVQGRYCGVAREYDQQGRIIKETYLNAQGEPTRQKKGYVTVVWEYNDSGLIISESYLDEHGRPISNNSGVAKREKIYDGRVLVKEITRDMEGNVLQEIPK